MTVETSFVSLLEKLKVEDPWLPPRTWESIPSQSRRPQSGASSFFTSSSSSSSSSSVSERSLVRLALNALQGVESALISIDKLSSSFCSESADRTFHNIPSLWNRISSTDALGSILRSIGCFGSLVFLLHKFVDHFSNLNLSGKVTTKREVNKELEESENIFDSKVNKESCSSYSLVNQAFAIAVRKVLEGYICALDTLCASVALRRSSNSADGSRHDSFGFGCLANVVHSELTLLEVYLHTRELRTQIEALGNICNLHDVAFSWLDSSLGDLTVKANFQCKNFYGGGDLLTYLYTQLKVADPAHHALLKFLFLRSCEPYCGFIRSWIFKAQVNDPYEEFIVECADDFPPHSQSKPGNSPLPRVTERDGVVVPCFLKGFLVPLVRAGQQLQVVIKLLELCSYSASAEQSYVDLLPCWTGYSCISPFRASLMTFSKMHIEAMVLERDGYYWKMQEKLGDLSRKLELSSEQVSGAYTIPVLYNNGVGSLSSSVSFSLEDSLFIPSTEENDSAMAQRAWDSDHQNTEDGCFSDLDASSSSECSSTVDSEERVECGLLESHIRFTGPTKQSYLSALSFSMITPSDDSFQKQHQLDKLYQIEGNSQSKSRTVYHDHSLESQLEESNRLCLDVKYTESLSFRSIWPLGGLSGNPFCIQGQYMDEIRLCPSVSGPNMRKTNAGFLVKDVPFFNRTPDDDGALKVSRGRDQLENRSTVNEMKVNYHCNVLGMNPMLMKSAFFRPVNKLEEGNGKGDVKLLPWFNFSSVDDPCKVCFGKLSIGFANDLGEEPNVSVTMGSPSKKAYSVGNTVVEDSRASYNHLCLRSEDHSEEGPPNASGGSGWESLLAISSTIDGVATSNHRQNSFGMFELPLDFVIEKCLLQEILLQYNFVSKLTITLLEQGFGLKEHLLALRRYHFMELADWTDLFIMSLWHHKWLVTEADQRIAEIQGFLESSIQRSSCERDFYKDRLFVYVKGQGTMPLSSSAIGVHSFDFLGLGYRVDWPVSIILTRDALKIYADIFSFLIHVKLAAFSLTDMWCSLKEIMHLINQNCHEVPKQELCRLNMVMKLRHQVNHFVSTLQQYVQSELSHVSWSRFLHSLKHKVKDMMDLECVHMAYLAESLHICFLSDETRAISSIIENILQCALDFRSCLPRGTQYAEPDRSDIRTKTSGVNTTQVMAIKQKFDKHMKELHTCYLRSPKHGEFGFCRFWVYLNFNEYYSELFNEATNRLFIF